MKENEIDYKALYEETISKLKIAKKNVGCCTFSSVIDKVLPELKESEDEKIRKELIEYLKERSHSGFVKEVRICNAGIAWLEKQNSSEHEKGPEMKNNTVMKCLQNSNAQIGELIEENFNLREELEKRKEQEPVEQEATWSENDEMLLRYIIDCCKDTIESDDKGLELSKDTTKSLFAWLKSLKDRVQPQAKQEWSEEDEEMFDAIIADILFTQKAHPHEANQVVFEREIDWLRSLKDRMTWRPTKEQMKALGDAIFDAEYDHRLSEMNALLSLDKDLKKL